MPIARSTALLARLETSEIEHLSKLALGDPKALGKRRELQAPVPSQSASTTVVETADGLPRGFVAGVLAAAGCSAKAAHGLAVAQVTCRGDGRPQELAFVGQDSKNPSGRPPACQEAGRVLVSSTLLGTASRAGTPRTLLVLLEKGPLECLAEDWPPETPLRVSFMVKEPRRISFDRPVYPSAARDARIQGMVMLDALIAPSGCVGRLEVVQGVTALNLEAIRSVAPWRYAPTLVEGKAVPVGTTAVVS